MIITIGGKPGSGKSTVARELAKKLNFKHVSAGDFMRELAKERGLELIEILKLAEKDLSINKEVDGRTKKFGKENDNFVMDGRIAGLFIPHAIKIFLEVSEDEAAKRIFGVKRVAEHTTTLASTKEMLRERIKSEMTQYQTQYGFNQHDHKHYDLVIDTTPLTADKVVDKILVFLRAKKLLK